MSIFTKSFVFISLSLFMCFFAKNINPVFAIDENNSSANVLIGQPDFLTNTSNSNGLYNPADLATDGTKLFIGEYGCRASVYNSVPTSNFAEKDFVIGQPNKNVTCGTVGVATDRLVWDLMSVATDGVRFVATDTQNNRVLIWNSIPTASDTPADIVLGQPNMTSNTANNGGISASSLYQPYGVTISGTKLIVTDFLNSRVLIWNTIPTTNNQPADVVIGQPDKTHNVANNGGLSASTLYYPYSAEVNDSKLYIADAYNNRVLIFNSIPSTDNAAADVVVGQPNMTSNTVNNGGISAHSLYRPAYMYFNGGKFFLSDRFNNRVLIWNTIPSSNTDADVVLGQPNMVSNTANNGGVSAHSLYYPKGVVVIGTKLAVSDSENSRVLIWNTIPTSNQSDADVVIGHQTFVANGYQDGGYDGFSKGNNLVISDDKLITTDWNHRIMIWNSVPDGEYPLNPDVIIGQPSLQSNIPNYGGVSAHSAYYPSGGAVCNGKLVISDYYNHRVLIWNSIPTTNNQDADIVVGQPNMTSNTANNGGRTAHSLNLPYTVACSGTKLFVGDLGNSRVLIWNTFPVANQEDADVVVGQPNMTTGTENNGGISSHSLSGPTGLASDGTSLIVSDGMSNDRVLIFNSIPQVDNADADVVLGQPDMTTGVANNGGISASSLFNPDRISVTLGRIFVSDPSNHRILGWNQLPTVNMQVADFVIGQADFVSRDSNITSSTLIYPRSSQVYNNKIYVADTGNSRIVAFPFGPQNAAVDTEDITKDTNVTLSLSAQGAKEMIVSRNSDFSGDTWEAYSPTKTFTLSPVEGTQNVYVKYKDFADFEGSVLSVSTVFDESDPTGSIVIGSPTSNNYTNTKSVTLHLTATDKYTSVSKMRISDNPTLAGASWENYKTTKSWTLSDLDGLKTVYVQYKDTAGNISQIYSDGITLDTSSSIIVLKVGEADFDTQKVFEYKQSDEMTFSGTGEIGSIVTLVLEDQIIGTTTVDENEEWSITPSTELEAGDYTLVINLTDPAGNKSSEDVKVKVLGESIVEEPNSEPTQTPLVTGNNPTSDTETKQTSYNWLYWLLGIMAVITIFFFVFKKKTEED